MSEENGTLVGKMRIEHNMVFIINTYGEDMVEFLLYNFLKDISDLGRCYKSRIQYNDCQIDDRETKCYFIDLLVDDQAKVSKKQIKSDFDYMAKKLLEYYKRDRIFVELTNEEGEWIFNEDL